MHGEVRVMKKSGIFAKVFVYTIIFSTVLVGATGMLFFQQLRTYHSHYQVQVIVNSYKEIEDRARDREDITEVAQRLYERNETFQFYIVDKDGRVVYETPGADMSGISTGLPVPGNEPSAVIVRLDKDYNLYALKDDVFSVDYGKWIVRIALISMAMLAACIAGAFIFARRMTKPIRLLADNANQMANLQDVPPLPERGDELGALSRDIYSMYGKLKENISELEREIMRERELEEAQRYFFSTASHELKTPIAAVSVLLEGMIADVGDYKNHAKYLRECVKMMDAQSEAVSGILEIANLSDGQIVPVPERLDIGSAVIGALPGFHILSEANGQRIVTDIPDGQVCFADPGMLKKALSNIILNAVQNTPDDGEIRIWCEPACGKHRLCVLNTGVRIDDAVLPKLFDPFYRVDKARNRKSGRNGLGLAIVQKTLEAMKVDFALENAEDGVMFWMDLPKN